jgi:repressor LexA
MLSISKKILPKGKKPGDLFALAASGESMTGAGILDGDWLIIESTSSAEVGDIVIARLDGDATVKRLGKKRGNWVLKPENPSYSVVTDPFEVIGKVVALQRVL